MAEGGIGVEEPQAPLAVNGRDVWSTLPDFSRDVDMLALSQNRCVLHGGYVPNCMARAKTRWPLGVDSTPAFPAPGHRSLARHSRCTQQSVPTRTQISAISNKIFWAPWHAPVARSISGMVR